MDKQSVIELRSDCCGANVEDDWFPGKKYKTVDDIKYTCSKCHKPCKVKAIYYRRGMEMPHLKMKLAPGPGFFVRKKSRE